MKYYFGVLFSIGIISSNVVQGMIVSQDNQNNEAVKFQNAAEISEWSEEEKICGVDEIFAYMQKYAQMSDIDFYFQNQRQIIPMANESIMLILAYRDASFSATREELSHFDALLIFLDIFNVLVKIPVPNWDSSYFLRPMRDISQKEMHDYFDQFNDTLRLFCHVVMKRPIIKDEDKWINEEYHSTAQKVHEYWNDGEQRKSWEKFCLLSLTHSFDVENGEDSAIDCKI